MNAAQLAHTLRRAVSFENDGASFEAEQLFRQLVNRRPPVDMAHFGYALFLLRQRRYAEAWPHFMQRLQDEAYRSKPYAQLHVPYWDTLDRDGASGETLLVGCDQGIGDALMCARYIPAVAERFKAVVFLVFKGFGELFGSLKRFDNVEIVEFEETLPAHDLYVDVFSLPAIFATTPESIPDAAWMTVDPASAAKWHAGCDPARLNIGIAWQGNNQHSRDDERSVPLSDFLPVLRSDARFVSLQVGGGLDQLDGLPSDVVLETHADIVAQIDRAHGKMAESAALISTLDLVISVDTAVAHLAGSLGIPCWVILPKVPDWRWMEDGAFSEWYPSTRLFRAHERHDRSAPIAEMRDRLGALIAKTAGTALP